MIIDVAKLRKMEEEDGRDFTGLENLQKRCNRLSDFLRNEYGLITSHCVSQSSEHLQIVAFTDGDGDDCEENILFLVFFTPTINIGKIAEVLEINPQNS